MKKLAIYDWEHEESGRGGRLDLYADGAREDVTGDKAFPSMLSAAVKFMFVHSVEEMTADGYKLSRYVTFPQKKGK